MRRIYRNACKLAPKCQYLNPQHVTEVRLVNNTGYLGRRRSLGIKEEDRQHILAFRTRGIFLFTAVPCVRS